MFKIIDQFVTLDEKSKEMLSEKLRVEKFKKKENILSPEKMCDKFYFITKGAVRTYTIRDGKEIVCWIYTEDEIFTSWHSYLMKIPSVEYIETLEETELMSIKYSELEEMYDLSPKLERFTRLFLEKQTGEIDLFYKEYQFLSAKEKYDLLMLINPQIFLRVKLGHISSMLGISQETLSRIRSEKQ